ncbi:MAG: Mor transcription activator family protein [Humidesulfovibrio sp.]|nr:Mor transcription activator family protein [Humidesulfovibrio sp.]
MTHDTPVLEQAELSSLPATARDMAQVIGLRKTLRLVETLGGTTFPVPKRETRLGELRFNVLAEVVGVEAAEVLVRRYGSTDLYIPRCADALRHARDAGIIREYEQLIGTMSGNEAVQRLARSHSLSDRRIFDILKSTPMATVNVGGAVQLSLLG